MFPLLLMTIALALDTRVGPRWRGWIYLLPVVLIAPLTLTKVHQLVTWQNYWLSVATMPFLCLYLSFQMPLMAGLGARLLASAGVVATIAGGALSLYLPSFSQEKPDTMNFEIIQDASAGKSWMRFHSFNRVPDYITRRFTEAAAIYPWGSDVIGSIEPIDYTELPVPTLKAESTPRQDGRTVSLQLRGHAGAAYVGLVLPPSSGLQSFTLDGEEYPITPARWASWQNNYVLQFRGTQNKLVEVELTFAQDHPVDAWLYDHTYGLPAAFQEDVAKRNRHASQIHGGDRHTVFIEVTF